MSPLAKLALEILEDPAASLGVKAVAIATTLAALEQGIEVPTGTHMAVWRHLLASDSSAVILHRQGLIHEKVARDAVRVLLEPDSGEGACDLAVAVLKGSNVLAIDDDGLVTLLDRMSEGSKVRRLTWLIERLHEERGLAPEFIVTLRDRLAGSDDPSVRAAGVEVGGLMVRLDEHFLSLMLNDPAPPVRAAAADLLEKADVLDRPLALVLARRQLEIEQHRSVLSSLHYATASLVRQSGRRIRMWEPPTSGEN